MGGVDVISVNVVCWGFVLLVCYDVRGFGRLRRVEYGQVREGGGCVRNEGDGVVNVEEEEEKGDGESRHELCICM